MGKFRIKESKTMIENEKFDYKNAISLEELAKFPETFNFKCSYCGKIHKPSSEEYFAFWGNVTIGLYGGLIGNNFRKDGTLGRITFLCRNELCLSSLLNYIKKEK
jgi:hypothetical protein